MTGGRDRVTGAALLTAAVGIACADILWGPALLQDHLPSWLGAQAGDPALIELLFNAAVFGVMILAAVAGGAIERRNVFAAGERPAITAALGFAVGVGGVSLAAGYAAIAGVLARGETSAPAAPVLLLGAGAVAIQAVGEELFFRGWLQPGLVRRWGPAAGVVATSLLFAGVHVLGGARAPLSLVNLFLGGLTFGLFALRGRGLAAAATAHWGWNATEQLVWGLDPNPGVGGFGAITDHELVGRPLWGGSAEGLNASVGMTFVLVAVVLPLVIAARGSPMLRPAGRPAAMPAE